MRRADDGGIQVRVRQCAILGGFLLLILPARRREIASSAGAITQRPTVTISPSGDDQSRTLLTGSLMPDICCLPSRTSVNIWICGDESVLVAFRKLNEIENGEHQANRASRTGRNSTAAPDRSSQPLSAVPKAHPGFHAASTIPANSDRRRFDAVPPEVRRRCIDLAPGDVIVVPVE